MEFKLNHEPPLIISPVPQQTHENEQHLRIIYEPRSNSAPSKRLRLANPAGIGGWECPAGGEKAGCRFGE